METTKQISCDQKLWFIAQNFESNSQTFYSINDRQVRHQCQVHELCGRRIRAYFHGWLILSDHLDNILWSLWNPLASKLIRLPPLKEKRYYECCLSSPPAEQGSVFVLLSHEIPAVYFCLLGPKGKKLRWTKMSYHKQLLSITGGSVYSFLQCPACCDGKVYAVVLGRWSSYKFVVQIDIVVNDGEVVINLLPIINIPRTIYPSGNFYAFLKGSGTKLFYIEVGFADRMRETIVGVSLFKLDMTSKKWKEMVDLEDGVFFIEVASGYLACYYNYVVDMDLRGYIHILSECGKAIYSFHVKDRTLSLNSFSCQGENQVSTCAMLEWRLEVDHVEEEEGHKDTKIVVRSPGNGAFDNTTVFDSPTGESHLLNLPLHILELIMELFVGVEYMKFRATCKHFCLAAPSIQWRSNIRIRGYSLVSPWLMILDNYQDTITFIDPLFGDKYYRKTPQGLRGGYKIYCSKYGWLLMYKSTGESKPVFFNPFTSNIRELPEVNNIERFCFSAPPTSPGCMVVGFRGDLGHAFIHYVYGESRWHSHNWHYNMYIFHFPTFNDRYAYALCNNEQVVAFRVIAHDGYYGKFIVNEVPRRSRAQYFWSSCDQHLLLVILGEFGRSVEVFEVDEFTEKWKKIDDLGKHMIYICNTSCFCLEAKLSEMGNKIFFPRFLPDDNTKIVFYSLETRRYHTFNGKKIQESFGADLFGTIELCHSQAWIEPSWSQ